MIDEPPPPPPPAAPAADAAAPAASPYAERPDGTLVIDLTRLAPPPPAEECPEDAPDPFQPEEIVVCTATANAPRLGPQVGPVDDGFASAIPRARLKLSENAEAKANLAKTPVGGFDADGAEVRVKIDF
ncbi:hypothetical protein ACLBKU_17200 [Erythrobacter sp. NE805]|uniref:hypothetical protein n=1 Tax=Erythrobacter sp. NE805 TaxID=3389875 RepID=UPI00396B3F9E